MSSFQHMALWLVQAPAEKKEVAARPIRDVRVPCPVGERRGMLTVIDEGPRQKFPGSEQMFRTWIVRCDCGKEKAISMSAFRQHKQESCGCLHKYVKGQPKGTRKKDIHPWKQ